MGSSDEALHTFPIFNFSFQLLSTKTHASRLVKKEHRLSDWTSVVNQ